MQPEEKDTRNLSRRTVIASATLIPVATLTAAAQAPQTALSASQRQILDAFVDRLIPKDELGPGALECGAANYIDRSLADALSAEKGSFTEGLAAVDAFARQAHGAAFPELNAERKDAVLTALEAGEASGFPNARAFFNRVRRLTLEELSAIHTTAATGTSPAGTSSVTPPAARRRPRRSEDDQPAEASASIGIRLQSWPLALSQSTWR